MADLDTLQIQIGASTRTAEQAIDKLITSLGRLNQSLNNYKADSSYTQGMNNLAGGLERVANAVKSIDAKKIKDLSRAITSLSGAGNKISLAPMTKSMSQAEKEAAKLTEELAKNWGIRGKQDTEALSAAVKNLYASIGKGKSDMGKAAQGVMDVIENFGRFNNILYDTDETVRKVRQGLQGLKWDKKDSSEFSDDLGHVLGTLGIRRLSKNGSDASVLAEELNGTLGTNFDTSSNTRAIQDLVEFLQAAQPEFVSINEAMKQGTVSGEEFIQLFDRLTNVELTAPAQGMEQLAESANKVDATSLDTVATALESIRDVGALPDFSGIASLASNINKLGGESAQTAATHLPAIADGLRSLEGITIPQFENINEFATGVRALGTKNVINAAQNLPTVAEGVRAFNGVTVPNLTGIENFAVGIKSLGGKSLANAATTLKPIAEGLRSFEGVTIPNFDNIESFATGLRSLGTKTIGNAAASLRPIAEGLRVFEGLTIPELTGLNQLAQTLSIFGRKTSAQAVENIPRLAQAFNELINSLDTSNVDDKTVSLAQSMAELSRNCGQATRSVNSTANSTKVLSGVMSLATNGVNSFAKGAFNRLKSAIHGVNNAIAKSASGIVNFVKGFRSMSNEAETSARSMYKLAQNIGRFFAQFWIIIRGVQKLWKSVTSSMDYVETLNYFKSAFKQVSSTAVGNWSKLGYDSAEAYADSFEKRAKQLTEKMSGFTLDDSGMISISGGKSLGLDPNMLLNYQAQFAQMASSMGASANNATLLSQVLTEIGADLASVKNMNFADVFDDMSSGMVGMSRALDKYGVNIRSAALNQKLLDLGIEATVNDLSGADKALLRTIVILDSTKYAWGDLANTINQPANQLRLLTANLQNCARMLGNIFLPIVAKVLPYLNAMTIALQRLLTFIESILGVDLASITSAVGGSNDALSDILDDADGLDDALDDASQSAKKLKNNLLGVDELNVISDNITSTDANGSMSSLLDDAFLDALSEYQKAWDAAFDAMENRANELADKIANWFKEMFKPISTAWGNVGESVKDAWSKAFKSLGDMLGAIGEDLARVWQDPLNTKIFENLFNILKDIGLIVSNLADNFTKAWKANENGYNILSNIQRILWAISEVARDVFDYFVEWAAALNFEPILESIRNLTGAIADNALNIVGIFGDWYKIVYGGIGKYLIEEFFPGIINSIAKMVSMINWENLRTQLARIFQALVDIAEVVGGWLLTAWDKFTTLIANFINAGYIDRLADGFENLAKGLKNAQSVGQGINAVFDFVDGIAIDSVDILNKIINAVDDFVTKLNTVDPKTGEKPIKTIGRRFGNLLNTIISSWGAKTSGHLVSELAITVGELIRSTLAEVDWIGVGEKIGEFLKGMEWSKILGEMLGIVWEILKGLVEAGLGLALENPIAAGVLLAIGKIVWTSHALKIANGLAKALTGQSIFQTIADAFGGIFKSKAVTTTLSEAGRTAAQTVAEGAGGAGAAGNAAGTSAGAIAGGIAGSIAAAIGGFKVGTKIGGALDEDNKWAYDQAGNVSSLKGLVQNIKDYWGGVAAIFKGEGEKNEYLQKKIDTLTKSYEKQVSYYGKEQADENWYASYGQTFDEQMKDLQTQAEEAGKVTGKQIIAGIGAGILAALATVVSPFVAIFNWIWSGLKKVFGIASPAKEMYPIGEYILLGIIEGFKGAFNAFWTAIQEFFGNIVGWFSEKWESIKQSFSDGWQAIKDTVAEKWEGIKEHFTDFKDTVTEWKDNTVQAFTEWKDNVGATLSEWKENFVAWKDGVIQNITEWKDSVLATFGEWKDNFISWKDETISEIREWKDDAVSAFDEWKTNTWNTVKQWFSDTKGKIEEWKTKVSTTLTKWKDDAIKTFDNWKTTVSDTVTQWKTDVENTVSEWVANIETAIENWKTEVQNKFERWRETVHNTIKQWKSDVESRFSEWKTAVTNTVQAWKDDIESRFDDWRNKVHETIQQWKDDVEKRFNEWSEAVQSTIGNWKTEIENRFNEWRTNVHNTVIGWASDVWNTISGWASDTWNTISGWVGDTASQFEDWKNDVVQKIVDWKDNALGAIGEFTNNAWNWLSGLVDSVKGLFSEWNWTFSGIASGLGRTFSSAWNAISPYINNIVSGAQRAWNALKSLGSAFSGTQSYKSYSYDFMNGRQWKFATGGFPEDGFFFANHNELVGRFSNGKTAVANNEQITDGIEAAVYRAMSNVMGENNREAQLLEELIGAVRAGKNIVIDGREIVTTYNERSARNGFSFT